MEKINIIKAVPNFPFLESTIDGVSYYQLLAGLNAYIDEVVDNLNSIGGTNEQYNELKEKVNNINLILGNGELSTDSKTIISAINELSDTIKRIETAIGNDNLSTSAATLIGAINELVNEITDNQNNIGTMSSLATNSKNSLVEAINEIYNNITESVEAISINENVKIVRYGRLALVNISAYSRGDTGISTFTIDSKFAALNTAFGVIKSIYNSDTGLVYVDNNKINIKLDTAHTNKDIYGTLVYVLKDIPTTPKNVSAVKKIMNIKMSS